MQYYLDESRQDSPHALPDMEVFEMTAEEIESLGKDSYYWDEIDEEYREAGWYYWFCFPGCLPESEPIGPYNTEKQALEGAREMWLD